MKRVIILGDRTDHGGRVTSASSKETIDGRGIARIHDEVSCPLHGTNVIVEGHSEVTIEGRPLAFEGARTKCGSRLIGSVDFQLE